VIPIPNTTGNVTVTFGALSYAGTLRITVLSDPSRMPDVAVLTTALRQELGSAGPLTGAADGRRPTAPVE
jgi:diacylglycerol O-acyltransferase